MSFTASELFEPRDVRQGTSLTSTEVLYLVVSTESVVENDIKDFIFAGGVAQEVDGLPIFEVEVSRRTNEFMYVAKVTYEFSDSDEEEDDIPASGQTDSFDTTGGTFHREYGLSIVSSQGAVSPTDAAAINYDGEKIQGVDLTAPAFNYQITVQKLDSEVTDEFIENIFNVTGKVNVGAVKWFTEAELLFLGAVGSRTRENEKNADGTAKEDLWEITYTFAGRKTETDVTIGSFTIAEVKGWDYVTVVYEDVAQNAAVGITRVAKSVTVVQVYLRESFIVLGIGFV